MVKVEWVRWNRLHQKEIDGELERVIGVNKEIDISNIKSIYVNFDRNKNERSKKIWLTDFQEKDKRLELEDNNYQFLNEICE